jgi:hypothetical protein
MVVFVHSLGSLLAGEGAPCRRHQDVEHDRHPRRAAGPVVRESVRPGQAGRKAPCWSLLAQMQLEGHEVVKTCDTSAA